MHKKNKAVNNDITNPKKEPLPFAEKKVNTPIIESPIKAIPIERIPFLFIFSLNKKKDAAAITIGCKAPVMVEINPLVYTREEK